MRAIDTANTVIGTVTEPDPDNPGQFVRVVYQRARRGHGHYPHSDTRDLLRRRYVVPATSTAPASIACRARFSAAVNEWHSMDAAARAPFEAAGAARQISGFNAWVSAFVASHPLDNYM